MSKYDKLKDELLKDKKLYEDPEFPATTDSMTRSGNYTRWKVKWMRPKVGTMLLFSCINAH